MFKSKSLILFIFFPLILLSQKKTNYEIRLTIDNDAILTPLIDRDRYYSSGVFIDFRKTVNPESKYYTFFNRKEQLSNLIHGIRLSQLIYTPNEISDERISRIDRPYAGIHSLGYTLDIYKKNNWIYLSQFNLGILGPSSKVNNVHILWHNLIGVDRPLGWNTQIANTPYINFNTSILKGFKLNNKTEVIYESIYTIGTVFNNINQGFTLRFGKLNPLYKSGYQNGLIGNEYISKNKSIESFIFIGSSIEYVVSNGTIEGGFIGDKSLIVDQIIPFIYRFKIGYNLHWQKVDFSFQINANSKENNRAESHSFGSIKLGKRF